MMGIRAALTAALLAGAVVSPAVASPSGCADANHAGGEWRSFGQDLTNHRNQASESVISASNVSELKVKYAVSAAAFGDGNFQSTSTIADGCLYAGTSAGLVFATNADTGALAWTQQVGGSALIAGVFGISVEDGKVFVLSGGGEEGPLASALDQETGDILWTTEFIDPGNSTGINASAVVWNDLLFVGTMGGDGDPTSHPAFFIVDADTGAILKKTYVIPEVQWADGYAGGGMWSTASVDSVKGFAYVGTSNPYSKENEHQHTNAVIKVDLNRDSDTFGEIVGHYKGEVEQYFPGLDEQPACEELGDTQPAGYSVFCAQLDIDFGASPNLFTDENGRLMVGALQKSGIFHTAYADTMERAWSTLVSAPFAGGNASTAAVDDDSVYVEAFPGLLYSLDRFDGTVKWTWPMPNPEGYQPVTVANGVLYALDNTGLLHLVDTATGVEVAQRALSVDAGDACATISGGIAIARNTIYATCDIGVAGGGWIVALGL